MTGYSQSAICVRLLPGGSGDLRTHLPGGGGLLAAFTQPAAIHVRHFPSGGGLSAV